MKCPICGAKLYQKQICKYCKVTDTEIKEASNKKVKEYRKTGKGDLVVFTNVIPSDVNKTILLVYTILLGLFGVNHFYVYRNVRGWFSVISTVGSMSVIMTRMLVSITGDVAVFIFLLFYDILMFMMVINLILWISDIFNLLFRTFKVPVILPNRRRVDK